MHRKLLLFLCAIIFFLFGFSLVTSEVKAEEQVYFVHSDHLGSTSLVSDEEGSLVSQQNYYPYGTNRTLGEYLPTERQYTGQVSDQEQSGLYYYNARYYHPQIAKFTQADEVEGPNRYAYVGNNPIKHIDPTGNADDAFGVGGGGSGSKSGSGTYLPVVNHHSEVHYSSNEYFRYHISDDFNANLNISKESFYRWESSPHYDSIHGTVFLPDSSKISEELESVNSLYNGNLSDEELYNMVGFHESRHAWQYMSSGNEEIMNGVVIRAQYYGLVPYGDFTYSMYKAGSDEVYRLPIRPHGYTKNKNTLLLNSLALISAEDITDPRIDPDAYLNEIVAYLTEDRGGIFTYTSRNEVDAIIAETIYYDPNFKYFYPELYNYAVTHGNFFNSDIYKPYYGPQMK